MYDTVAFIFCNISLLVVSLSSYYGYHIYLLYVIVYYRLKN